MAESMLDKIEALRNEALEALRESEAFRAFKALDDAVAALGGVRRLALPAGVTVNGQPLKTLQAAVEVERQARRQRVSQAEGAEIVLKERRKPMTSAELLEAVADKGVTVGGEKPLMSFGSTLSRDPRFLSFR